MAPESIYEKPDPESARMVRSHVAELLAEQIGAGARPAELEELGYTGVAAGEAAAPEPITDYDIEASGQLLMRLEAALDSTPEPEEVIHIRHQSRARHEAAEPDTPTATARRARPARRPGQRHRRPKARTYKEKAARDSRPDLKPWPYGTRED